MRREIAGGRIPPATLSEVLPDPLPANSLVKGSKNRANTQLYIAKLHAKIANIRNDATHKLTSHLTKNHSEIVIEDLNVSGMMKNHKLASEDC